MIVRCKLSGSGVSECLGYKSEGDRERMWEIVRVVLWFGLVYIV